MRYFQEYRHKFTNAPGMVIDAGKKLLGYIANQKRLSGVDSLIQRIAVNDESGAVWLVEARFDKDIPSVRIFPPNSDSAVCELYVESGLLDLGPNIAADAGARFNRGLPAFSEDPARLYFGTDVACVAGQPGLNGAVRLQGQNVASDCLPNIGNGIASRLTSAVKKQAQALLPASCWSGLMQRYVQAVYGGASLDYEVGGDMLLVEGVNVGGYGASVGLVEVAGTHLFVFAGSGEILMAPLQFKSACGAAVYQAWKNARTTLTTDQSNKLLTIALSDAYPGDSVVIGDAGDMRFASPYGWQFSPTSPEAHAVAFDETNATLKRLVVTQTAGGISAAVTDVETAELPPAMVACKISGPGMPTTSLCSANDTAFASRGGAERGSQYEHPVGCYYNDGLVIVRYIHDNSTGVDVIVMEGGECGSGYSIDDRQNIAIPGEDGYNYSAILIEDQGDFFPADFYHNIGYQHIGNAITGVYAKRGSSVLWSTVEDTPVQYMKTLSEFSPYGEFVGGSWVFQTVFSEYVPDGTVTLTTGSSSGGTGVAPVEGFSGTNYPAEHLSSDQLCGRGWEGYFMNCGEWSSPVLSDSCEPGETRLYEMNWSIEVPIAIYTQRIARVSIISGAAHEIALPRGDCSAIVCARINRKGCYPRYGMDADASEYASHTVQTETHYSGGHAFYPPIAPDPAGCSGAGTVTGAVTLKCNGALSETAAFSSGSAEHLSACTTCWVPGIPWVRNEQVAAFMQTTTKMVTDDATTSERSGGFKQFGAAGTDLFTDDWTFSPGEPFEFLIDSIYGTFFRTHVTSGFDHAPTDVDSASGGTSIEELALVASPILQQDFDYMARRSLLSAKTRWSDAFAFGASINMDRETITGGYSPVSTPSFVGWA